MSAISTTQTRAFRSYVLAALNLTDEGVVESVFSDLTVQWSPRDNPQLGDRYALLRELAFVTQGTGAESIRRADVGASGMVQRWRQVGEWSASVQVVVRQGERAKAHATNAAAYLSRVRLRLWGALSDPLEAVGLGPLRVGPMSNVPSMVREQHETRVSIDLTFSVSQLVTDRPHRIEVVAGTGTIVPLPPQPFQYPPDED